MRKLIRIVFVILIASSLLVFADACNYNYGESFAMDWSSSINSRAFSVKVCDSYFSAHISANSSVRAWNNISSQVNIATYSTGTASSPYTANIIIAKQALTGDTNGHTVFYQLNNGTGVYTEVTSPDTSTTKIHQVRIVLAALLEYKSVAELNRTVLHEMGHALLLRHPYSPPENAYCSTYCAMQQTQYSNLASDEIESHDINCLVTKWG